MRRPNLITDKQLHEVTESLCNLMLKEIIPGEKLSQEEVFISGLIVVQTLGPLSPIVPQEMTSMLTLFGGLYQKNPQMFHDWYEGLITKYGLAPDGNKPE